VYAAGPGDRCFFIRQQEKVTKATQHEADEGRREEAEVFDVLK
jgi:hypothetical protein